jgi:hypothetical protein
MTAGQGTGTEQCWRTDTQHPWEGRGWELAVLQGVCWRGEKGCVVARAQPAPAPAATPRDGGAKASARAGASAVRAAARVGVVPLRLGTEQGRNGRGERRRRRPRGRAARGACTRERPPRGAARGRRGQLGVAFQSGTTRRVLGKTWDTGPMGISGRTFPGAAGLLLQVARTPRPHACCLWPRTCGRRRRRGVGRQQGA